MRNHQKKIIRVTLLLFLSAASAGRPSAQQGIMMNDPLGTSNGAAARQMNPRASGSRLALKMAPLASARGKDVSSGQWTLIGPQPLTYVGFAHSGQVNALAVDSRNTNVVYLGAGGGGVWKTADGGQTWAPLTDNQPSLQIGALALDPTNPDIIYAGTAISNIAFGNLGLGILKSADGGTTWTQLPGPLPYGSGLVASVPSLAVSPNDGNAVLAGAHTSTSTAVYRSMDGGNTWNKVLASNSANAVQVFFDPSNANVAYASLDTVYKSTDGGSTWAVANGTGSNLLPAGNFFALAIAASSPETLFAGTDRSTGADMFKTVDGGQNWTPLSGSPPCWTVQVDPANANVVFAGAGGLRRSTDGGSTWSYLPLGMDGLAGGYHGGMAFSADGGTLYLGNELGVWAGTGVTGNSWTVSNLNTTLATIEFLGIATHPTNPAIGFGGSQSSGVDMYSGQLAWVDITSESEVEACDDGGPDFAFDFMNPTTLYVACTSPAGVQKSTTGGASFFQAQSGIDASEFQSGTPPALAMDPSNSQRLYVAAAHVWQTNDGANTWIAISPALGPGNGVTQALAVAPSDPNMVYLGNSNGVFVTTNANQGVGALWHAANLPSLQCSSFSLSCTFLNQIAVDPSTASTAYVALAGYVIGHVYKTTDGGATWTDISGNLPNLKVNDIVVDPDVPDTLYIATERGVYSTADGGNTWSQPGAGLPNATVTALNLQRPARILRAATLGRSAWDLYLGAVASPVSLSSTSLSFSQASSQNVTLTNNGTAPLTLYGVTAPSGFSQTNNCGVRLQAGGNCSIAVSFAPHGSGSYSGNITISDDAPGSPQSISVAGTGSPSPDFALGMASGSPGSITVTAGQTANYSLIVTPQGGFNQSASMACSGAPSLATCTVSPSVVPLDGKNAAPVTVNVTTTAPSLVLRAPFSPPPHKPGFRLTLLAWAAILALMGTPFTMALFSKRRRVPASAEVVLGLLMLVMTYWVACGGGAGGGGNPGTPPGTYTLTVTGTYTSGSTNLSHKLTLTLVVK